MVDVAGARCVARYRNAECGERGKRAGIGVRASRAEQTKLHASLTCGFAPPARPSRQLLRHYMEQLPPEASGWLAGARDPMVGAALALLHRQLCRRSPYLIVIGNGQTIDWEPKRHGKDYEGQPSRLCDGVVEWDGLLLDKDTNGSAT